MLKKIGWFSMDAQKTFMNLLKMQILCNIWIIKIDCSKCKN